MRPRRDPARARLRAAGNLIGVTCFVAGLAAWMGLAVAATALGALLMAAAHRDRRDELMED